MIKRYLSVLFLPLFFLFPLFAANSTPNVDSKHEELAAYRLIQAGLIEAEDALEQQDYTKLKALYAKMGEFSPEKHLSEEQYQDFLISQAYSEAYLNQFEEALLILQKVDQDNLTPFQRFRKELFVAKMHFSKGEFESALLELNEILKSTPIAQWPMQDRSFYLKASARINQYYEDLKKQADEAYEASLYSEALPLYKQIKAGIEKEIFKCEDTNLNQQLLLRLAHTCFFCNHFSQAKSLLTCSFEDNYIDSNSLYLLILASEELGEYREALKYARDYQNLGPHHSQEQLEAVRFEEARIYYKLGEYAKSEKLLTSLTRELKSIPDQYLCRLYKAKIFLKKGEYAQVEATLHPHFFDFSLAPSFKGEWAYLRAEAFFQRKEYPLAIKSFEQALTLQNEKKPEWYSLALDHLGRTYLKIAEDPQSEIQAKQACLQKAEKAFKELLKVEENEKNSLALAKVYLLENRFFQDPRAALALDLHLKNYPPKSEESKLKAGLMLAEVQAYFSQKETIYNDLLKLQLKKEDQALLNYLKGCNMFLEANKNGPKELYQASIDALNLTWSTFYLNEPQYLLPALKTFAAAVIHINEYASLSLAYQFLDSFESEYPAIYQTDQVAEVLLYFKALIASKVSLLDQGSEYLEKGIKAIQSLLVNPKMSSPTDQALYLLGTLYYQQQNYPQSRHTFLKLIEGHPDSKWIGDAWFWAAQCNDLEKHDPSISREYRRRVFEQYSSSSHAEEAYFHYYAFADYLKGRPEALNHLQKMEQKFPGTPFLVVSFYLQALNAKEDQLDSNQKLLTPGNLGQSIHLFDQAVASFQGAYKDSQIEPEYLGYLTEIYYKALLGKAQACSAKAEEQTGEQRQLHLEQAMDAYEVLIADFEEKGHELAALFFQKSSYPGLLQEAEFGWAKAKIQNFQLAQGEAKFNQIIERYLQAGIKESYYHSRAWYELSLIAMARENYSIALDDLQKSKLFADDRVTSDQKVDLGIQESYCYRFMGQLDQALLALSEIINEELASELRVKAMYLRAEIYELQGRKEVAQRQLEASSKKEGKWARMSLDRLVADYGLN